ncbi:hypothetical protein [Nannocystis sp.]|uniref:hypothetical protein n=1 Tax=Nannocystis sp. TaxID=1962667 RepID=UPI002421C775|nr:hypothetical protein [Nannocystis sp.]MBK7829900.1 hypothetical protein [Nannocystis sp.]MBK9757794.1 hypothetical protein [Nannocystis sp.]
MRLALCSIQSLCAWFALVLTIPGCNQLEAIDESASGGGGDLPPEVVAAFERSCGNSPGCHAAGGQSPTLDATVSSAIIGGSSNGSAIPLVTLGDTANSYIAIKMLPDNVIAGFGQTRTGGRMPLGFDPATGSPETLADTQTILAWIAGADFPGGGGGTGGMTTGGPTTGDTTPTFTRVKNEIIAISCSCHLGPPSLDGNGNFSMPLADAYTNTVGVKSIQAPMTDYFTPGDPLNSYIYLKMTNMQSTVTMNGDALMPDGATQPLPDDKLKLVKDWIDAGAMDD